MNDVLAQFSATIRATVERRATLWIRAGGTKDFFGNAVTGELFDTRGYTGIVDYEPGEMVITSRCGTLLSEIEEVLKNNGQMLAFEPPYFGPGATFGGCIAAGLSGPRRANSGAVRDFVLGVRILNGRGEDLSFGGHVMKNVAGYDVSRLMAGSLGTLGVLLEASIKVLPAPASEITLRFEMDAATSIDKLNRWCGTGVPISASCCYDNLLTLRLSGSDQALAAVKSKLGGNSITQPEKFWRSVKEQTHEFFKTDKALWRLSVKSSSAPLALPGQQLVEWNGSLRWYIGDADANTVRRNAEDAGGHAILFRRINNQDGVFHPLSVRMLSLHQRLKRAFDPHGIFNPGKMYTGL